MTKINEFLLDNDLRIASNPCVSPDFCLDWPHLSKDLREGKSLKWYPASRFSTRAGEWELAENRYGDHAWVLNPKDADVPGLSGDSILLDDGRLAYPATWAHLLELKNRILEFNPGSTIFPSTSDRLGRSTIGVGARFTTLHWPGVDWAMSHLGIGMTANQNSIPRELVFDVDVMLSGRLEKVPFPFIGADVPEGHQGQSVEGMSHGCVLAKLKSGFHRRGIAWSFNADHQPIGGKFDSREDQLVEGCLLATYITFDLSPELALTQVPESADACAAYVEREIDSALVGVVERRVKDAGIELDKDAFNRLLASVWPSMRKMKVRDEKYRAIRREHFSVEVGCEFLRELSIDELPGLTTPETTAIMLALCEAMEMPIHFVAPAFGFQKNMPYPDNQELRELVTKQWEVCRRFGVSIGFHSGSGKSAENYRVMGDVTSGHLEIKTSGRYTYEMGVALAASSDPGDRALWKDWYLFTLDMAVAGAFSSQETEKGMARTFIAESLKTAGVDTNLGQVFESEEGCRNALLSLKPSPDYMFWFEYNFLFVLAAEGKSKKAALGDHSPRGYLQRSRFYSISNEGRLNFARRVALYLTFLAENTGLVPSEKCQHARVRLEGYTDWSTFYSDIEAGV